jgi:hypothetical protein
MNRITITFKSNGDIGDICSDEPVEIYFVDPNMPADRVYLYQSAKIGPEHVRNEIGGYAVGHRDDGTLPTEGAVSPMVPPSRPGLRLVKDDAPSTDTSSAGDQT